MKEDLIKCPNCGADINLSEVARHQFADVLAEQKRAIENEEKKKAYAWAQKEIEAKTKVKEEEEKKYLQEIELLRKSEDEAKKKELEFLKMRAEFESTKKNIEIEKEKAVLDARKKMEEELREKSRQEQNLELEKMRFEHDKRMAEMKKTLENTQKALDDANMKAKQGSMQVQGEVQENELREILSRNFPVDSIEDIATGKKGADLVHTVRNTLGHAVGVIAWESKNTKHWTEGWVGKLKEDRLLVNASVSIIVTNALPEGVNRFGPYKDIWVTDWQSVIPLTLVLREQLISMEHLKNSMKGKDEKMEVIYNYLISAEFRDKIQNITEAFQSMKDDLDREKRAMEKNWSMREKQLTRVITNTAKLYGDMQGIIGAKLGTIETLELPSGED